MLLLLLQLAGTPAGDGAPANPPQGDPPPAHKDGEPPVPPTPPEPPAGGAPPTPAPSKADVVDGVEMVDGEYVFRTDPNDPNSTMYHGKSMAELLSNVRNGIVEKDTYIAKLRNTPRLTAPKDIGARPPGEPPTTIEPNVEPDDKAIYRKHLETALKQNPDVSADMLRWDNAKWKEHASASGLESWEVMEARQKVREILGSVQQAADAEIAQANVAYVNRSIIDEETEQVEQMLLDAGIDRAKFDYKELLDKIWSDEKNRGRNGVIKTGVIVRESAREINRIEKIEAAERARAHNASPPKPPTPTPAGASGGPTNRTPAAPTSYEQASREALKAATGV